MHDAHKSATDKADVLHDANLYFEVVEVRCPFLALQHAVQTRAPACGQHMTDQKACIITCSSSDRVYEFRTGLSAVQPCCAAYSLFKLNSALGPEVQTVDMTQGRPEFVVLKLGESETPIEKGPVSRLLTGGVMSCGMCTCMCASPRTATRGSQLHLQYEQAVLVP